VLDRLPPIIVTLTLTWSPYSIPRTSAACLGMKVLDRFLLIIVTLTLTWSAFLLVFLVRLHLPCPCRDGIVVDFEDGVVWE